MRIRSQVTPVAIPNGPTTLTFYGNQIPTDGLVAIYGAVTGAGGLQAATDISNYRLKAGGDIVVDYTSREMANLLQGYGPHKPLITPALATTFFYIPLNLFDLYGTEDMQDVCQFPQGKEAVLEITITNATGGGTLALGFLRNPRVTAQLQPRIIGEGMGIPASATRQPYSGVSTPADFYLRDVSIPVTGLDELIMNVPNAQPLILQAGGVGTGAGGNLLHAQQLPHGIGAADAMGDPMWLKLGWNAPFVAPGAYFSITSDSNWVGAANRMCRWMIGKQGA